MLRKSVILLIGVFTFLSQVPAYSQTPDPDDRPERAPNYRANILVTAGVPIMMTNRIQREAFRGLIATELTANFFVAKGFHMGFGGQYNVFQTRSPNDFKIKNRDILQHHITPGITLGYEARLKRDQRFSFYPSIFAGYTFNYFTGLRVGVDTSFYPNPNRTLMTNGFMISPQLAFFMHMNDEYDSVVGFIIGFNLLSYELKKRDIYLSKIFNGDEITDDSYFVDVPDNGITSYFKIGFVFQQKIKKIKPRINNTPR